MHISKVFMVSAFVVVLSAAGFVSWSLTQHAEAFSISSIKSGNWSDPSVWNTNTVPKAGDTVTVAAGHSVAYNILSDAVMGGVTVKGMLKFSRTVNTRLKTNDNIIVEFGGFLDMGHEGDYIPKNVKAELIWVLTQEQAKTYVGGPAFQAADKGLWVMEGGTWEVYGEPLVRTWSKLAEDAPKDSTTVIVENNVADWPVGGTIAISSTRVATDANSQNELRIIKSLEKLADGKTKITLDLRLKDKHDGVAPFKGEVALITRNILIKTELVDVSESVYPNDVRTRKFAHTMFMHGSKGNIQYAEFKYMGNYGTLSRYAIHPHMMLETSKGMIIRGTSGWYNGFRCVNLHATYGVLVEDNVCYSSSSTSYFIEFEKGAGNIDNVLIHNIGIGMLPKHFDDRNNELIFGEGSRAAVDFWPGTSDHKAFLGNIAVGDSGSGGWGGSSGWFWDDDGGRKDTLGKGKIPATIMHNEAHSKGGFGIGLWDNSAPAYPDIVDMLAWRNAKGGISWGAYGFQLKFHKAQLLENVGPGFAITSINSFVQDSTIAGHPTIRANEEGEIVDQGYIINAYIIPQGPNSGPWNVRNTFRNIQDDAISQVHKPCGDPALEKRPIISGKGCTGTYITQIGNKFENVKKTLDFGWQSNANAFWRVFDYPGNEAGTDDFVLLRKDQLDREKQGPISAKLVTPQTTYNSAFDALVTPMSSLPPTIFYDDLEPNRRGIEKPVDYTFVSTPDYPPKISLDVTLNGKTATMKATASDDKKVTKVEFFVDWINVGTKTAAPYEVSVDLSKLPSDGGSGIPSRKYAYLYARAFDGTNSQEGIEAKPELNYPQRAYSDIFEIGPEVLLSSGSLKSRGDLDGDGKIDIRDIAKLLSKWGSKDPQDLLDADISVGPGNVSQGEIDIYDANRLMANWTP